VLYRSKMNPNLKRNFVLFPVLDWIAEITAHIPNKGEQLVRYYGVYSNASRGRRKKPEHKEDVIRKPEFVEVAPPPMSKELKRRWSHFIQKVYETDPLVCPKCSGQMRIISFIGQRDIIIYAKRNSVTHELRPGSETECLTSRMRREVWRVIRQTSSFSMRLLGLCVGPHRTGSKDEAGSFALLPYFSFTSPQILSRRSFMKKSPDLVKSDIVPPFWLRSTCQGRVGGRGQMSSSIAAIRTLISSLVTLKTM